jgi:oligopeptide/dipeptide ABC transporter ATP-binding protein
MSMLFISHDLGVVAEVADRVLVMYAGRTVEEASVDEIFSEPRMPYTIGLIESVPRVDKAAQSQERLRAIPGNVPNPAFLPKGCAFEPRCRFAIERCKSEAPPLQDTGAGHMSRCWRWGELASDATAPATVVHQPPVAERATRAPLIEINDLRAYFPIRSGVFSRVTTHVKAVQDISFSIGEGEVVGLVGESGSGKTTAGRAILRLVEPTGGEIRYKGQDITRASKAKQRELRKEMQIIFQDPFSSLDPRMSAGDIVAEPLRVHGIASGREVRAKVAALFERVGLRKAQMDNYPHQFSGGQRQRIGIARALALQPKLIVGDEPVSALDVSIQAQVLNLMMDLQRELGLAYLFISHNLAVIEHISHRIAVMYLGRIVEYADKHTLFTRALHPYTEQLLLAVPVPDPRVKRKKRSLQGDVPSPINPPSGCHFHTRCPYAEERCRVEVPALREVKPGQMVACHLR